MSIDYTKGDPRLTHDADCAIVISGRHDCTCSAKGIVEAGGPVEVNTGPMPAGFTEWNDKAEAIGWYNKSKFCLVETEAFEATQSRAEAAEAKLAAIQAVVDAQAEDEGLWFEAKHITEDYLQDALRYLHEAIEEG